eukprot:Sspe_Gene.49170::Locus_26220_Transcript_1_1_Confidence_1.000_Length_1252::g.49170::m.49170
MTGHRDCPPRRAIAMDALYDNAMGLLNGRAARDGAFYAKKGTSRELANARPAPPEVFTSAVVLDLHGRGGREQPFVAVLADYLAGQVTDGVLYMFEDHALLPADADCTAVGLSALLDAGRVSRDEAQRVADTMVGNVGGDGIFYTYFSEQRKRVDPVVCVNVLYFLLQLGREDGAVATNLQYVLRHLRDRSYLEGSRYYHSPDTFLYFLARLASRFPSASRELVPLLRENVRRRAGSTRFTLDVAMRVVCCRLLEMGDGGEQAVLAQLCSKGWGTDAMYRCGRSNTFFGSEELTAAFVAKALEPRAASKCERRL